MPIGKATETDVGRRLGITPAITLGMIPGIGTIPGTMVITATTAVGIHPGIMVVTIAPGGIGDGTDRDTTLADIIV